MIFARVTRHNFPSGENATVELMLSHFSTRRLKNATVSWHTDIGHSGLTRLNVEPAIGSATLLGTITVPLDGVPPSRPSPMNIYLELRDESGAVIATNRDTLYDFPARQPGAPATAVNFYDPANHLSAARESIRSSVFANVMVATRWDDSVSAYLQRGGRVIVLADGPDALPANLPIQMRERKGDYDGNWISNFAWVAPQSPLFRDITGNPILGWEAAAVMPHNVLQGVNPEQYDDVLAGMFYGWLHNNSPLLVQARVGNGIAIVTTFRFDQYSTDPYAQALLDAMIRYIASDACRPEMQWR